MSRPRCVRAALTLATLLAATLASGIPALRAAAPAGDAHALVETDPVLTDSDAADDIAIWRHPTDPSRSLVIGTDKTGWAVEVYDLEGERIQRIAGARANGVDLRHNVPVGGDLVDLVAVGGDEHRLYRVDPDSRRLVPVELVDDGSRVKPNGVCLYRSPESGHLYLFGIDVSSQVDQLEVADVPGGIELRPVRDVFDVGSDAEACVADDDLGHFYVNEADVALWRYGAEPEDSDRRVAVDETGSGGHLEADVEGLTIVYRPDGTGYLIASSQGDDAFAVYRREDGNDFVRKFRVTSDDDVDGCSNTDGIDALAAPLGPRFPHGIFICQDHHNSSPLAGNQNFKYVRLEEVVDLEGSSPTTTTTTTMTTTTTTTSTTTGTTAPPATTSTTAPTTTTTTVVVPPTTPVPTPDQEPESGPEPQPQPDADPAGKPSPPVVRRRSGYWMATSDGTVYAFGDARLHGARRVVAGREAVDIEATPSGEGYWIVDDWGQVSGSGDARHFGNVGFDVLDPGERATSLSATPSGRGYWVFTTSGRAVAFGDAPQFGDMSGTRLNGPVLDSIPTPSGQGYYMVASDGGIFSFGDARFHGSMGGRRLNAPVQSLVPDPDGTGYWLVASDGGVFSFDAPFRGSMGAVRLNQPVTGMVPFGNGYLMVATDGGIFNFSDRAFHGSLGGSPPPRPVISVTAL